jgi:hypothetical protein
MTCALVGTFGFFGLHTCSPGCRAASWRCAAHVGLRTPTRRAQKQYQRFTAWNRACLHVHDHHQLPHRWR